MTSSPQLDADGNIDVTTIQPADLFPENYPYRHEPWCRYKDKRHTGRPCESIVLAGNKPVEMGGGYFALPHLRFVVQKYPGRDAVVILHDAPVSFPELSGEEAEQLADTLKHAAWVARQACHGHDPRLA